MANCLWKTNSCLLKFDHSIIIKICISCETQIDLGDTSHNMSSAQDPFYIVKEEIQECLQRVCLGLACLVMVCG